MFFFVLSILFIGGGRGGDGGRLFSLPVLIDLVWAPVAAH